eukprot:GHVS01042246.1.p1 GENE.GHVS01042246.1~~GHVS01042246.1.p1  ORF type:complete len:665 (-),score=221.09 GHVS01042246.1:1159-3153(-)
MEPSSGGISQQFIATRRLLLKSFVVVLLALLLQCATFSVCTNIAFPVAPRLRRLQLWPVGSSLFAPLSSLLPTTTSDDKQPPSSSSPSQPLFFSHIANSLTNSLLLRLTSTPPSTSPPPPPPEEEENIPTPPPPPPPKSSSSSAHQSSRPPSTRIRLVAPIDVRPLPPSARPDPADLPATTSAAVAPTDSITVLAVSPTGNRVAAVLPQQQLSFGVKEEEGAADNVQPRGVPTTAGGGGGGGGGSAADAADVVAALDYLENVIEYGKEEADKIYYSQLNETPKTTTTSHDDDSFPLYANAQPSPSSSPSSSSSTNQQSTNQQPSPSSSSSPSPQTDHHPSASTNNKQLRQQRLDHLVKESQYNLRRQQDPSLPAYPPFKPFADNSTRGSLGKPTSSYRLPVDLPFNPLNITVPADPTYDLFNSLGNLTLAFQLLSQQTPPLNATPGINDLTAMLQTVLPADVRARIVASTPEDGFGVLSNFLWDTTGELFLEYLNVTNFGKEGYTSLNPLIHEKESQLQAAAIVYNNISGWAVDIPFAAVDALNQAGDVLYDPIDSKRQDKIDQRDGRMQALLDLQTAAYEPIVNASVVTKSNLDYVTTLVNGELSTLLTPVNNLLTFYRRNKSTKYLARRVGLQTMRICAINPICCERPEFCAPVTIDSAKNS